MFIWATMNSADQGVFPMDTAYLGIDESDAEVQGKNAKQFKVAKELKKYLEVLL